MENTQQSQPNNHVFTYMLVTFFAVFIGSGLFLVINKSKTPVNEIITVEDQNSTSKVNTQIDESEGKISLQSDIPNNTIAISTQFSLDLVADSKTKNVVGYDVVLSYDPLAFEFVKVDSLLSDYKIYSYKKDGYITLTATKDLQSPASSFSDSKIAKLYLKPTKAGKYTFALKSVNGNEKTDFITDETEILRPSINDLLVSVE